ncbi:MAG TPA: divalent metal cation transporter [Micromonosporaceae bacterium]
MKRLLAITLGILTAIGGFVDIGDLVANGVVGSRFGMHLAWVVVVGVGGICVYAEMCGRVAATSGRPVFDIVRERLGPRWGLANLFASFLVTALTLTAEIGGVALALELASTVSYLLWAPLVAFAVWVVIWRVSFKRMETTFGLLGLLLLVFGVAVWRLRPDYGALWSQLAAPEHTGGEGWATYAFFAVALFGAAMTPYEVFFFSSGGVEERWTRRDLPVMRANVLLGFPLGGLLSLFIMAAAAVYLRPGGIRVEKLDDLVSPVTAALGKVGLALAIIAIFAATFGAALETGLSCGYSAAQYFGWQWGKFVRPREASRFHVTVLASIIIGLLIILTTVDPVKVTEYSIVLSAGALPLTYLPILVVANDPDYMGEHVNGRLVNGVATAYLVVVLVASVAAIPLMIVTGAGA